MDSTSEQEDIRKIDAILSNENDCIDEVLYDDFIVCDDSSPEKISDEDEVYGYNFEIPELMDIKNIYKYDPLTTLIPEEKAVIDSCHDPDLRKLLVLNRTRRLHLIKLYKKMKDLLIECKQNIIEKYEVVEIGKSMNLQHVYSKCWRLAAPYFKDKQYFLSPPNRDTLRKKADSEISSYDFGLLPRWSRDESDKLIASVVFNYNLNRQVAIERQISKLTRNKRTNQRTEQIRALQKKLEYLEDNTNEPPPLGNKYTEFECRSFWHTYLHPKLNKGPWSSKEDSKLKQLVAKYGLQNWTQIAESLGTKRTGLLVCMHYFRDLHRHIKLGPFTEEEDDLLLSLIDKHRMGTLIPWAQIVTHFKNRKRTQIYQRTCCHMLLKRGEYTLEEDERIMEYVKRNGTKTWGPLSTELNRSMGLLRQRYQTIASFLNRYRDKTIKDVPRRKSKSIPSLQQLEDEIEYLQHSVASNSLSSVDPEEELIDWKLVEFFRYSALGNKDDTDDRKAHDLRSTMLEFETVLNSLRCKLNIHTDFNETRYIDSTDLDILNAYRSRPNNLERSEKLVPPNLNTCLALRSLLMNHARRKRYSRPKMNLNDCLDTARSKNELSYYTKRYGESQKKTILSQMNSFYRRFYALFKWPAVLSGTLPNVGLLIDSQHMPTMIMANGSDKHYTRRYQTVTCVSNGTENKIDSINPVKRGASGKNSTETSEIEEKSKSLQPSHLSIRIIRNAKEGTEIIKVLPDTRERRSNEATDNGKMRHEITVHSAFKPCTRKAQGGYDRITNDFLHSCADGDDPNNSQNGTDTKFEQDIEKQAELMLGFVDIKQENVNCHGDIQLSQTSDQCPQTCPEMLNEICDSISDDTKESGSSEQYINNGKSIQDDQQTD
nr:unnamed protein product [Callosobruchus chinensis]